MDHGRGICTYNSNGQDMFLHSSNPVHTYRRVQNQKSEYLFQTIFYPYLFVFSALYMFILVKMVNFFPLAPSKRILFKFAICWMHT